MKIGESSYKNINYCIKCGKKLDLQFDREEKLRPRCNSCGWTFYKNPIPASACVILNESDEIVVIKRGFEPKAGEWALPSGYIEIYQSPEETAVEEMLEETGLEGSVNRFLGYFKGFSPIYETIISFGFLMNVDGGSLKAGDDALEAVYASIFDLPEIAFAAHRYYIGIVKEYCLRGRKWK